MAKTYQERLFDFVIIFHTILIIIFILGLNENAIKYWHEICFYIKLYISIFLIIRFNPFRKNNSFDEFDSKISFNAGMFLLIATALEEYLLKYVDKLHSWIPKLRGKKD